MAEDRHITTLYRYFLWADHMRARMEFVLTTGGLPETIVSPGGDTLFLYTSYYHSALYVVVEGWQDLKLGDPGIDALLALNTNVALLKRFRHGTFHFQREYLDSRVLTFVQSEGIAEWTRSLRDAFAAWFEVFFADAARRYPKEGGG